MKIESDVTVMLTQEEINEIIKFHLIHELGYINSNFELYAMTKIEEAILYKFRKSES